MSSAVDSWTLRRACLRWQPPRLEKKKDNETLAALGPQHAVPASLKALVGSDGSPPSSSSNYDRPQGARAKRGEAERTASGKGGQEGGGRGEGSSSNRHFVLGRNQSMARHQEWSPRLSCTTPHQGDEPTAIPRLCSLQDPCKGEGEDPLGVSSNSRLIRLGNAIRCHVIYFTGPSAKLGDVEGLCHHLSEGSLGFS